MLSFLFAVAEGLTQVAIVVSAASVVNSTTENKENTKR